MLLRFSVTNHLSFRDKQELSLVASSLKDVEAGLLDCPAINGPKILPAVVIYGANASGKSNFVGALAYMRSQIRGSHMRGEPSGGVKRMHFALDPHCAKTPSKFDIDFISNSVRYHYGFESSDEAFISEWLYAFPRGSRQMLFERKGRGFKFGRNLKGRNKVISDLTRPNSLFLSTAIQNDHKQLLAAAEFFQSLRIDRAVSIPGELVSMQLAAKDVDERVIDFLGKIGTGVIAYRRQEKELDIRYLTMQREIYSALQSGGMADENGEIEFSTKEISVELAHRGSGGDSVFLNLNRESAGTRRLLMLLGRIYRALDRGGLLLIDELDASLHTQACEALLALFSRPEINTRGAQMIATTHDTNLLRSSLLRRDQVWFTEKDLEGATHLYPLTDIRTREGDNIGRGYLQGRFGAIPFAGPVSDLFVAS